MTQEQTPQTPTDSAPENAGSLDAAEQAFQKLVEVEATAETAEDQAEASDEDQNDDPNAEADEGQSDEDNDDAASLAEVEFEGKTYKVPPELEKALLRQADYSRKMNEVSTQGKTAAQRLAQAETLAAGAEKYAEQLAEIGIIDRQIKQYEALNWQQIRQDNPGEYAAHAADLHTLRLSKQQAEARAAAVSHEVEQTKHQALAEKRGAMLAALQKSLPGWGDELGTQITAYATANGVALDTLQTLTDPGVVLALEKARKYDALQKGKADLRAKSKDLPPVLKPGATRKTTPTDDAMATLRKHKTQEAAEAAFLSRMR